jgi:hypothetical protein
MPRKATYLGGMAARGYLYAIILAVFFYAVAFLCKKRRISIEAGVIVIVS